MQTLEAYKTNDGTIFDSYEKAKEHECDLIGEALDALVLRCDRGNITEADRHRLLLRIMADPHFIQKVEILHAMCQGVDRETITIPYKKELDYINGK